MLPEGELAARFGVNRLAVREAIRALAAREILVSSQGRPARVNVPTARVFGQILGFRLRQQSLVFDDVLDARGAIEGALVSRAAVLVSMGEAMTDAAAALLDEVAQAAVYRERFVALDLAFHHEIARMVDNGILELVLESLSDVLAAHRPASYEGRSRRGDSQQATITAHRRILDAIAAVIRRRRSQPWRRTSVRPARTWAPRSENGLCLSIRGLTVDQTVRHGCRSYLRPRARRHDAHRVPCR
ncbi:FadR/GntR family transcriptional regulator [Streptomyces sp. NPDC056661]|uniref:FadR/GntR family transcriptional regulator n=1 Tax=Streptomyces sp. NPDC056661 TaxID=3345898 RepID=UPI00367553D7